jgi:hypothetical protein
LNLVALLIGLAAVALLTDPNSTSAKPRPNRDHSTQPMVPWRGAAREPRWIWGVTLDRVTDMPDIVESLESLSEPVAARIVFDFGQPPSAYVKPVSRIHKVAGVMGEILDSYPFKRVSVEDYLSRTRQYLNAMGKSVDVWEVGNEVNGDWLGPAADVQAKVVGAYNIVKARKKRAAITLFYNEGCAVPAELRMFDWAVAELPASMRQGLDYVFVSYYEDACRSQPPDWPAVVGRLASIFPKARIGIGECGTADPERKAQVLARSYAVRVEHPRFVGGFFWWYFSSDMIPRSKPLWPAFDALISRGPFKDARR